MITSDIGLSGCTLELISNTVLRKISPSESYNIRLRNQMEKQIAFQNKSYGGIIVPAVTDHGLYLNKFYFDMMYVNGKLFEKEFTVVAKEHLESYLHSLIGYLNEIKNTSVNHYTEYELKDAMQNKLSGLYKSSKHLKLIDRAIGWIDQTTLTPIEKNMCHGDLTFSNMLFVGNKICFLDFLDSYIESYVMDLVKLKQDLYYNWHTRVHHTSNATRIKQIFKFLWDRIEQEFPITKTETFHILDLINFLRIEPYVKNEEQKNTLDSILGETWLYEKFNSSYDGEVYTISKP